MNAQIHCKQVWIYKMVTASKSQSEFKYVVWCCYNRGKNSIIHNEIAEAILSHISFILVLYVDLYFEKYAIIQGNFQNNCKCQLKGVGFSVIL